MREALVPVLSLALTSCGFDRGGLGIDPKTFLDDVGGVTDDATDSADGATDPVASKGDPYPRSAVSFFQREICPTGWELFPDAKGRTILPTIGSNPPGTTNGVPLASGEDRKHVHKFTGSVNVSKIDMAGFDGSNDLGEGGAKTVTGSTDPASAGLPFVQLLVCRKTGPRGPKSLPSGVLVFFDLGACPAGFHQNEETQGRVIVGLPAGAGADLTFGAGPMFGSTPKTHTHALSGSLETSSHGIALVTGCCNGGFAENGSYPFAATTEPVAAAMPSIELLACTKD